MKETIDISKEDYVVAVAADAKLAKKVINQMIVAGSVIPLGVYTIRLGESVPFNPIKGGQLIIEDVPLPPQNAKGFEHPDDGAPTRVTPDMHVDI
jgi:hypothetical protein